MFDIWYCPSYPLDEIQVSDKIKKEGMDVWRPALAKNISEQGLVNPLIVLNHRDPKRYKERWLKVGNNRYWALKHLGWTCAPVVITGTCPFEPKTKVTFEEASALFKDGKLSYDIEAHGGILQIKGTCNPEKYEYPQT